MVYLKEELEVPGSVQDVFGFVGEFQNMEKWDPGVKQSTKSSTDETAVGSKYDLITIFGGKESEMTYEITEYSPPPQDSTTTSYEGSLTLIGENKIAWSKDIITVKEGDKAGRSVVTYEAEICLKGIYKLGTPFVRNKILALGPAAMDGLRKYYNEEG